METKKRFFASHAKSSAAVVSLVIHAILIIMAFTLVAATVIIKEEQNFKTKAITRPKMPLKRLQVPVNVKKKTPKPKLRKRIVVNPKINQNMPDIKMPEVTGVKGGLGSLGEGGVGSVGFTLPEVEIFGVKGKGEKIFLILDTGSGMMDDKMGGIAAYTIIKQELVRIVDELPATALFNVCVFEWGGMFTAFPSMVSANKNNAKKLEEWLMPLNVIKKGMGDRDYGVNTLGKGGSEQNDDFRIGLFKDARKVKAVGQYKPFTFYNPVMLAHKQNADTIFLLTNEWGVNQRVQVEGSSGMSRKEWDKTADGIKWKSSVKEGLRKLDQENRKRKAAGQPPKIMERNEYAIMGEYFPNVERPPNVEWYNYTPRNFIEAFLLTREKHKVAGAQAIINPRGRKKRASKRDFSFNVIQFMPLGEPGYAAHPEKFRELTTICNGEYQTVSGLEEVQSYVQDTL